MAVKRDSNECFSTRIDSKVEGSSVEKIAGEEADGRAVSFNFRGDNKVGQREHKKQDPEEVFSCPKTRAKQNIRIDGAKEI